MTYVEAAKKILKRTGATGIWMGEPDIFHAIYNEKWRGKEKPNNGKPEAFNAWYAVYGAVKRSNEFICTGYIKAPGFTAEREIRHPYFELANH
jgi:hypothetical protein